MKDQLAFELIFDGDNLNDGEIDVKDLAPSLLSLSDLLDEASVKYAPQCGKVSLRVKPNFEKKCFKVYLDIAQSYYAKFVELFSSQEAQAWAALAGILGISGIGLFQLLLKAKNRKPKRVVEIEHTEKVRITFEGDDEIEVPKEALALFQNNRARKAVAHMFKPLKKGGVEKMKIQRGKDTFLEVDSSEANYFDFEDIEIDELESETQKILRIISPSFKEGNKWRLNDGNRTEFYEITDQSFLDLVREKKILFGINDFLLAKVLTYQKIEDREIHTRHEITEARKFDPPENEDLKL